MSMSQTQKHGRFLSINYAGPVMTSSKEFFFSLNLNTPCQLHSSPLCSSGMAQSFIYHIHMVASLHDIMRQSLPPNCAKYDVFQFLSFFYTSLSLPDFCNEISHWCCFTCIRMECFKTAIKYLLTTSAFERIK